VSSNPSKYYSKEEIEEMDHYSKELVENESDEWLSDPEIPCTRCNRDVKEIGGISILAGLILCRDCYKDFREDFMKLNDGVFGD